MSLLQNLQRFLAVNRKPVTYVFVFAEIAVIVFLIIINFQAFSRYQELTLFIYQTGRRLGQTAIILYSITLLPGIITRLQWFPKITQPIASIILPFRRHFGILMFLTAFVHMSLTTTLPYMAAHNFKPPGPPPVAPFQMMGSFAWWALFPLWLTSNDFSQKRLGKWWKRIHKLTYVALFFIFFHVMLQRAIWVYVIGPILILEIISWIVAWRRNKHQPVARPIPSAAQPVTTPTQSNPQIPPSTSVADDPEL